MDSFDKEFNIKNVYNLIKKIYDSCLTNGENWEICLTKFLDEKILEIYEQLPWLNELDLNYATSGQIVRFRGMVQDMYDPEYYMNTYMVKKGDGTVEKRPGKYCDVAYCGENEELVLNNNCDNDLGDRTSYCCISIPGEADWVKEIYIAQNNNCEETVHDDASQTLKRSFSHDQETDNSSSDKKLKEDMTNASTQKTGADVCKISKESKFPLPNSNGMVSIVKVYGNSDHIKLNDTIEVVGILTLEDASNQNSDVESPDFSSPCLPPSIAPRLHALKITDREHMNPLLPTKIEANSVAGCTNLNELLKPILDLAFLGDDLAAQYFMCHLISSVFSRKDVLPVGKCSVNISGLSKRLCDEDYPKLFHELISKLTTHSFYLPMTLEHMNKSSFIPKKDYEVNSLKTGILQLPKNLHLTLDETKLTAGQLDSTGVANLTALGTVINWQKLDYDFQFHRIEQLTNVPVVILSEGKSMINSDYRIRLKVADENCRDYFEAIDDLLSPQLLHQIRIHITLATLLPHRVDDHMQKKIQEDFVNGRKESANNTTADSLHSLLTIARLLAQTYGKTQLTAEIWEKAKSLESDRKARL